MGASIREHHDVHLAEHYAWLLGGLYERVRENKQALAAQGIVPQGSRRALDLGSGSGLQAIPLAQLGFEVVAVDPSAKLLADLAENAGDLPIAAENAPILRYLAGAEPGFELCTCMGDTLTYFSSFREVLAVFRAVHRVLEPGGTFVLAFTDFTPTLGGVDRFVPVHADDSTIVTCFFEYAGDHVHVHDLVCRRVDGAWELKKRVYRKLRIAGEWVVKRLSDIGFTVELHGTASGQVSVVARRP